MRVTAEDGHQANRSYWIASAPKDGYLVLTVEQVADGVVSSYLVDDLRVGDQSSFVAQPAVTSLGTTHPTSACCHTDGEDIAADWIRRCSGRSLAQRATAPST